MKDEFNRDLKYCLFCKSTTAWVGDNCLPCTSEREKLDKFTQIWSCSQCEATGAVEYVEDERIERVMNRIVEDHRSKSTFCLGGMESISAHNPIDGVN